MTGGGIQKVYVVAASEDGPCKIGISANPKARLGSLQTGSTEELILWSQWEPEHLTAFEIEQAAHFHFWDRKLKGEWFDISVLEAERFIGAAESDIDGFKWITSMTGKKAVRVFDGGLA